MKVGTGVEDAYAQQSVSGPSTLQTEKKDDGGYSIAELADTLSLSPQAQIKVTEDMLLTSIGQRLGTAFEEIGIDLSEHVDEDQSPDAVSQRIFEFATGMMEIYRQQNPEMSEDEIIDSFEETIRGAVDQGYSEAMNILEGMDAINMDDELKSVGERTMEMLHEKLDGFFAELRGEPAPDEDSAAPTT